MLKAAAPTTLRAYRVVGIALAVLCGALALGLVVLGNDQRSMSIGILIGLWAIALGYLATSEPRRIGAQAAGAPSSALALVDESRDQYGQQLELMLRREIDRAFRGEMSHLREEIADLRTVVEERGADRHVRVERIETRVVGTLHQDVGRISAVHSIASTESAEMPSRAVEPASAVAESFVPAPFVPEPSVREPFVPEPAPFVPAPAVPDSYVPEPYVPEQLVPEASVPEPAPFVPAPALSQSHLPEPSVPEPSVPEPASFDPPEEAAGGFEAPTYYAAPATTPPATAPQATANGDDPFSSMPRLGSFVGVELLADDALAYSPSGQPLPRHNVPDPGFHARSGGRRRRDDGEENEVLNRILGHH